MSHPIANHIRILYVVGASMVLGGGSIEAWTGVDLAGSVTMSRSILDETKVLPAIGELSTNAIGCSGGRTANGIECRGGTRHLANTSSQIR